MTEASNYRCVVCGQAVPAWFSLYSPDAWHWRNVAPDAASGGTMMPCHDRCAQPFQRTNAIAGETPRRGLLA